MAPMPVPAGSVHARTLTKRYRANAVVSRSQLVELRGCDDVCRHIHGWAMFIKKIQPSSIITVFVFLVLPNETQLYEDS